MSDGSSKTLMDAILPKSYAVRVEELEKDVRDLREQLGTIVMPEIELRAAMRLTPDSYWDWLLDVIKAAQSSPEQLHWIGFITRLHADILRGSISSHLIADLYTSIRRSRDLIPPHPYHADTFKEGVDEAYSTMVKTMETFLQNYPRLYEQVKVLAEE